uniref:Uncharacterized protein n=1 Tax=Anguilla anguilla TaxID=7936 RepID=A0A0E9XJY5_ANGAN
MLKCATDHT